MAYPFAQAPTVREVVDRLVSQHGCVLRELDAELHGPRGPVKIQYLIRNVDGRDLLSEPLPSDLDERLSPDTARRLIVQLKLDPESCWHWAGNPLDLPDDDD
jgi:hypothetical protein